MRQYEIFYILYFFIYSFLGWMVEVSLYAAVRHRFVNRGISNLPFCISYGFIMVVLIKATNENTTHGFIMFLLSIEIVLLMQTFGGFLAKNLFHIRLWDYRDLSTVEEPLKSIAANLIISFSFFTALKLVHPFTYVLVRLLPGFVRTLACLLLCAMLSADMLLSFLIEVRHGGTEEALKLKDNLFPGKKSLGMRITNYVIQELDWGAVPTGSKEDSCLASGQREEACLTPAAGQNSVLTVRFREGPFLKEELDFVRGCEAGEITKSATKPGRQAERGFTDEKPFQRAYEGKETRRRFASGLCFEKAIWIMIACGLLGNVCETLLVHYQTGIWMRRGSLVFIPISLVWGLGGVTMTLLLENLAQNNDFYVFLVGFFFGGAYEYLCSVFTEYVLGTRFWDYHNMPFNINGRTNLLFMVIWGIVAFLWNKLAYPWLSAVIEGVTPSVGMAATRIITLLLTIDILLTGVVILRSYYRHEGMKASNFVEEYIDENYSDEIVKRNWRNIRFGPNAPDSR